MKTISKLTLVIVLAISMTAFTNPIKKKVDIKESSIEWTGKKVLGSHNGTIQLQEGYLEMEGNILVGGMFVIDMTSITVTDLEAGKGKEKLEGHLKSDDFFGIKNHPTASFEIDKVAKMDGGFKVGGTITIKGTSKPISFDLKMDDNTAIANLKIDRTKFDVKYGSGSIYDNLGDKAINDIFELDITLKF